jgi:hypothetical protein
MILILTTAFHAVNSMDTHNTGSPNYLQVITETGTVKKVREGCTAASWTIKGFVGEY